MEDTQKSISENKVVVTVKELIAICLFVLSIGVSIGGFIKVLSDMNNVSSKLDNLQQEVHQIELQNAQTLTALQTKGVIK